MAEQRRGAEGAGTRAPGMGHLGGPSSPLGDLLCDECGTKFSSRTAYGAHRRERHGGP